MRISESLPGRGDTSKRRSELILAGAIVAMALALRARGIDWGLPALTEEATPFRKALGFWGVETGRVSLNPHFFNYPSLTFYFHFAIQAVVALLGFAGGAWTSFDDFRSALAADPATFIRVARWSTAAIAAATVIPVYLAARRLGGPASGIAAGLLLALNPTHAQESRLIGTDVPLALCTAMGLLSILNVQRRSSASDVRRAGIWWGLAASCKYPGALLGIPVALALWPSSRLSPGERAHGDIRRLLSRLGGAGLCAGLTFAATSPYVVLDLPEAIEAVAFERFHMATGHFGASRELALFRYAAEILPRSFSWPGVLLLAPALAAVVLRFPAGRPIACFALGGLLLIGSWRVAADRYALLIVPASVIILALGAGFLARRFLNVSREGGVTVLIASLLAMPGGFAVWRDGTLKGKATTRATAAAWALENIPRSSLVCAESYSIEAVADSFPLLMIPFDSVQPHAFDAAYSLPYYQPFEYAVLSSAQYNRYLSDPAEFPAQASFYEGIGRDFDEVRVFDPGGRLAGPTIRILRRRPGISKPDFRNISGAFYSQLKEKRPLARFLTALGAVLSKAGKDDLALAAAEQSVALASDDPKSLSNLAALRARRGEYLTALKGYQRALEYSPEDPVLHYNLGRLYQGQELYGEAEASFARAIQWNPRLAEAYLSLAACQVRSRREGAARETLRRFLALFPRDRRAGDARALLKELGESS